MPEEISGPARAGSSPALPSTSRRDITATSSLNDCPLMGRRLHDYAALWQEGEMVTRWCNKPDISGSIPGPASTKVHCYVDLSTYSRCARGGSSNRVHTTI